MTPEQKESFMKYQREFIRETYVSKTLKFNKESEKDLLEWLDQQPAYAPYVKKLIREDM